MTTIALTPEQAERAAHPVMRAALADYETALFLCTVAYHASNYGEASNLAERRMMNTRDACAEVRHAFASYVVRDDYPLAECHAFIRNAYVLADMERRLSGHAGEVPTFDERY